MPIIIAFNKLDLVFDINEKGEKPRIRVMRRRAALRRKKDDDAPIEEEEKEENNENNAEEEEKKNEKKNKKREMVPLELNVHEERQIKEWISLIEKDMYEVFFVLMPLFLFILLTFFNIPFIFLSFLVSHSLIL